MSKTIISVNEPTPKWATWVFRIIFLLTSAALIILAADPTIPDGVKFRVSLYLKAADVVVWGIGRALGVKKEDFSN
jgi:hypothetical protein